MMITGEANIANVQFLAQKSALKLESIGMKRRGRSVLSIVKEQYGYKGNAAKVLAQMEADWTAYKEIKGI